MKAAYKNELLVFSSLLRLWSDVTQGNVTYINKRQGQKKNNNNNTVTASTKRTRRQRSQNQSSLLRANQTLNYSQSKYIRALKNPFDTDAVGVRIPDGYSFPTTTFYLRERGVITSASGGNFKLVLSTHPYLTSTKSIGSIDVGNAYSATNNCQHMATPEAMDAIFSSWRVVAGGWRICNVQPQLSAQGTYTVAPIVGTNQRILVPAYWLMAWMEMKMRHYLTTMLRTLLTAFRLVSPA